MRTSKAGTAVEAVYQGRQAIPPHWGASGAVGAVWYCLPLSDAWLVYDYTRGLVGLWVGHRITPIDAENLAWLNLRIEIRRGKD